jgi:hypothetical protein
MQEERGAQPGTFWLLLRSPVEVQNAVLMTTALTAFTSIVVHKSPVEALASASGVGGVPEHIFRGVLDFIEQAGRQSGVQAFICFAMSDYLVQLMVVQKNQTGNNAAVTPPADVWRSLRAGALGVGINAIGYSFFVENLNSVFPHEGSEQGLLELGGKVLTDSFVWGTISNSLNIFGRCLLEGQGVDAAIMKWREEIQDVTLSEFKFWPLWNLANFHIVPRELRVSFAAFGAFIWNMYMSVVAVPRADSAALSSAMGSPEDAIKKLDLGTCLVSVACWGWPDGPGV